jgi:NADH-quinone oxidoreductase subunit N
VTVLQSSKSLLWLVVLAIAMSAVSLYYYLKVLKRMYVAALPPDAGQFESPVLSQVLVAALAAAVVLLGCAPHLLLRWIEAALQASGL